MENNLLSYHLSKVVSELETKIAHRVATVLSDNSKLAKETSKAEENLMTNEDLYNYLQISSSTFYKLKKRHKDFPVVRILGNVRYKKSDVVEFLKNINKYNV